MDLYIQPLLQGLKPPCYSRVGDAGLDLMSYSWQTIPAGEKLLIGTGLAMAIPEGHVGLIRDRSGLALKHGLTVLAGVIDSTYRGEIKILLLNTGTEPVEIRGNDRIAQLLVVPVPTLDIKIVETLPATNRGDAGFGSSGR